MTKEGFNWKGLFINEETSKSTENKKAPDSKPAEDFTKFPTQPIQLDNKSEASSLTSNPFAGEIMSVYEKGFESLNIADFDFFELYKSVVSAGSNNPQSYQMAFNIGKSIKPDLTKSKLLEQSTFYIQEIEKVHTKYATAGNAKKSALDRSLSEAKGGLTARINEIEKQITELQRELTEKRNQLALSDNSSMNEYAEIQLKIEANDFAKERIVDSIKTVVAGINQYL